MSKNEDESCDRLALEWLVVNAFREMLNLASFGNANQATYKRAIELGGQVLPDLLGESSLIRAGQSSSIAREYQQRAKLESRKRASEVTAIELLNEKIASERELLAELQKGDAADQIRIQLKKFEAALIELSPVRLSENQAINRDVRLFDKELPKIGDGHSYYDYRLTEELVLRVRALHPDKAEEILGADLVYERHSFDTEMVEIVLVQYKIWDDKKLYLSDARMKAQLERMSQQTCKMDMCKNTSDQHPYRFPYCCSFLRPTDRLQSPDQALRTTGLHLPLCYIDSVKSLGSRGADILEYDSIKSVSLTHIEFESLFRSGKIGSRSLSYDELRSLYGKIESMKNSASILLHGQSMRLTGFSSEES